MAQQGIESGGDRPEPRMEDRESASAKHMEQLGAARARNENEASKPMIQKIQDTTSSIKDYVADKMDSASAAMKTSFSTGNESIAERSRDSVQGW
ncbi:hypothetical protein MPTK1_4g13820 [Marchantia polymorpha subsp. ruderalis]|uniref:Uncharacterized protein n=2 Tax=Marchantia polymorpha TaxID=3197 RepID=A0AAF6B9M6_MARPO|nr:hypothetical protein MARPO_0070s0099 [Marchantia polymorpha]BBN08710.1 hypothetical protein Mp_4g13820 [Marchantia polymorpha subsp. ruderalis]|eukprot:PTQ35643.1 hypothetical protein MARPO_0070s0099 [Marchantia polymorpha]